MDQNNLPGLVIIDDDPIFRNGILFSLENKYRNKLDIKAFEDGGSALNHLRQLRSSRKRHVIIFLDYLLGNSTVTGREVFNQIVTNYQQFTVIVFTGKDPVNTQQSLGHGAYATLHKPLDNNELFSIIDGIIQYDAIFNKVAVTFEKVTQAKATLVFKFHRDKGHFAISGKCSKVKSRKWPSIQIPWTLEFHHHLRRLKEPAIYNWDTYDFSNYDKSIVEIQADYVLRLPLIRMNKLKGFIDCFFDKQVPFPNPPDMYAKIASLKQTAIESIRAAKLSKHHHALNELNHHLTLTPNGGEQFLTTILEQVLRVVSAQCAWVDIIGSNQPDKIQLKKIKYANDLTTKPEVPPQREISMGDITSLVAREKRFHYHANLDDQQEFPENHLHYPEGSNFKAEAAIPLRKASLIIGVLTVKSLYPHFLSMDDIDFLRSVAAITATSIETEKLVIGIGDLNNQTLMNDAKEVLPKTIVNTVKNLTGTAVNFWKIGDKKGNGTNYMHIIESTDDVPKNYRNKRLPNNPDQCFNAQALINKKPLIVNEIQNHPERHKYWFLEEAKANNWQSFAAIPILGIEQEPLGVISIYSEYTTLFESDIEVVATFSQNVSTAYQLQTKSRIMRQLTEATERLTRISFESTNFIDEVFRSLERASTADHTVLFFEAIGPKPYLSKGTYDSSYEDIRIFEPLVDQHDIIFISDINKKEILTTKKIDASQRVAIQEALEIFTNGAFFNAHQIQAMAVAVLIPQETRKKKDQHGYIYTFYEAPRYFTRIERQASLIYIGLLTNLLREYLGYQKIIEREKMLDALYKSGIAIRQGNNPEAVATQILTALKDIADYTEASIQEIPSYDEQRILLAKRGNKNASNDPRLLRPVNEDKLVKKICTSGKPLILSNTKNTHLPKTKLWEVLPETKNINSWIGVPLKEGKKIIGLLTLGHKSPDFYQQDLKRKLDLFAAQASIAIIRTKQLEERSWINLGHLAGSLAHRIGNKGSITKLDINELKKKLGNLPENDEIQEQLLSIEQNNDYILSLSQELFRPTHASKEKQYSTDLIFLLQSAIQNASIPTDIKVTDNFEAFNYAISINANSFFVEMFLEIITNAVKAMKNSPKKALSIQLEHKRKDQEVYIHFKDTGSGFSPNQEKDIFNLFSTTNQNTGNNHGFGLWWIKVFLDNIGGKIEAKNRTDDLKGAIFSITLPVLKIHK